MSNLPTMPIVISAATAVLCLLLWQRTAWQRWVSVVGALMLLAANVHLLIRVHVDGPLTTALGAWPAPLGINLVADPLAVIMTTLTAIVGLAAAVYSLATVEPTHQKFGYFPLLHLLLMGVSGSFLTGDLFNLYVWFEVMLISSFVLLALGGTRPQMEGALKYVSLNLLSSALFLAAVGVLYGAGATLNMADLHLRLPAMWEQNPGVAQSVAALLMISFGLKAGLFPLYFWLPASYHTPPIVVSAVFAGLLTKVGVYALYRVFTIVYADVGLYSIVLFVAGLTMISGVLGAVAHFDIRRILSFHIISQIGYMVLGLGLLVSPDAATRRLAVTAGIFYIAHHIIVKTNLFLVGGVINMLQGSYDLKRLGGLASARPWLAVLFLIPALSLAGIPPLSGFWAKLGIIRAALEVQAYIAAAAALFAGLLTLVSMMKIWNEAFWKPVPEAAVPPSAMGRGRLALTAGPMIGLAALTVFIGLVPQPLFALADSAAEFLLDPQRYVDAVGLTELPIKAHEEIEP